MNPHTWFVEHRAAYATRSLDADDEKIFADHLPRCSACQDELRELERALAWLPMGVEPIRPRPGFHWRAIEAVVGRRSRRPWRNWIPLSLAAAALLLAVVSSWRGADRARTLETALADTEQHLAALADSLSVMRSAARVLHAAIEMDGSQGGLLIFADSVSHRWNVVLHGLPAPAPDMKYQFWYICSDGMVRGIELEAQAGRPFIVTVGMPERGGEVLGASLTVEPVSNQTDEPRGEELAHLML